MDTDQSCIHNGDGRLRGSIRGGKGCFETYRGTERTSASYVGLPNADFVIGVGSQAIDSELSWAGAACLVDLWGIKRNDFRQISGGVSISAPGCHLQ